MNETRKMLIQKASRLRSDRAYGLTVIKSFLLVLLLSTLLIDAGCTTAHYRKSADKAADKIIKEKQEKLFGKASGIDIERPSDILRRRLLIEQDLPYSGNVSLGSDKLDKISHWPEKNYPSEKSSASSGDDIILEAGKPVKITLVQALEIAAKNSSEYQTQKESVFQTALDLNLQRHEYGFTVEGTGTYTYTDYVTETDKNLDQTKVEGTLSLSKKFKSGAQVVTSAGIDIVNLLTEGVSTKTFNYDGTITIPLLRGSGAYVNAESLTQAERDLVYSLYTFERYKATFSVEVVQSYMNVLSLEDQVTNAAENYKNLITSSNRTSRLGEAGRADAIEVNQAIQNELSARDKWISAVASYESKLDSFKITLGLPADADIELDRSELTTLSKRAAEIVSRAAEDPSTPDNLVAPGKENAGHLEMDETDAIKLALENRLDLKVLEGKVIDAQRAVVIKADRLRAEVTLFGEANFEGDEDEKFNKDSGLYTGLLTIDLPLDRTEERNDYRNSYIALEQAVRSVQTKEDDIKQSIRSTLRTMAEAREGLRIQTQAVSVAETGYKSANMFYEAGRSELRDLLDAQASLLSARNSLTSAIINFRMAELQFQRDAGILMIDDEGLLVEYDSEEDSNVKLQ